MDDYTLPRTGQPPLVFQGTRLAEADGHAGRDKDQNRWHEIAVYRTAGGTYVVAITYQSRWDGEVPHYFVTICLQAGDVTQILRDYDPTAHVQGYPAGPHYVDKQARLVADLTRRYALLATELFGELGAEFAEVIE